MNKSLGLQLALSVQVLKMKCHFLIIKKATKCYDMIRRLPLLMTTSATASCCYEGWQVTSLLLYIMSGWFIKLHVLSQQLIYSIVGQILLATMHGWTPCRM